MRSTCLNTHLDVLLNNARALRSRLPEKVAMLCVVKADAYGHGAAPLARALEAHGLADCFAVAIVEEAQTLRDASVRTPIVILGGSDKASLEAAAQLDVSPAVYLPEHLYTLERTAGQLGRKVRASLKLDTGMSRIGVRTDAELERVLDAWADCPNVAMDGAFTHFCAADTDPEFTCLQNDRFAAMIAAVRARGHRPIAHAAASSAMLDARCQHDMVRAGIALYGACMPALSDVLCPAQTLSAKPVRVETIEAGDTVGYGRTFAATRRTRLATLPIGYGDGYPRLLGGRAQVLVRGVRAPIVGRVCMDMLMVDVTDVPGLPVTAEDECVLLGAQGRERIAPDELADLAGTIPYEIMLGFSGRVRRTWTGGEEERS